LVWDYTEQLFPGKYDKQRGILDFGDGSQRLRDEVAPITPEMRLHNPVINYFERSNPGWRMGHELPCIAEISISLLKRYLLKERRKEAAMWTPPPEGQMSGEAGHPPSLSSASRRIDRAEPRWSARD
jgi:hypothetical protein